MRISKAITIAASCMCAILHVGAIPTSSQFSSGPRPRFLMIGDSNMRRAMDPYNLGFETLLERHYMRKVDIFNRGLDGYTTKTFIEKGALEAIASEFAFYPPNMIAIMLGTNDAAAAPHYTHVPLEDYKANLQNIVHRLHDAYYSSDFLLICPPPVNERQLAKAVSAYTNNDTQQYSEACLETASALHVPSVELFGPMQNATAWPNLFVDGLHLNKEGNKAAYTLMQHAIDTSYPKTRQIKLQYPK